MELRWTDGAVVLRCPVCCDVEDRPVIATVAVWWQDEPVRIARCPRCASVLLDTVLPTDVAYTGEHWDWDRYLELQGSIEAIAETLSLVDAPAGSRLLDVGCGYGFALDLGVHLHGWTGIGLDPSPAAARGRVELALDIRAALLDPDFAPGERFDVVVASEVLEHVTEPAALLHEIARRLEPGGAALVTVPNGALVSPETPVTTTLAMLSAGAHVFLPTPDTLADLLADAGLAATVSLRGHAICAVASPTEAGLARANPDPAVPIAALAEYCRDRAAGTELDSALGLGMATRTVKFLAYDGRFPEAADAVRPMRDRVIARHGLDLDDADALRAAAAPPAILAAAGYFAGVTARHVDDDPDLADARWRAAARAAQADFDRVGRYEDPEVPRFAMQALGERALLHAPTAPRKARQLLAEADAVAARSGIPGVAESYHPRVAEILGPEPSRLDSAWAEASRITRWVQSRLRGRRVG
jgi:SAM-dependent methyltransferase